MKKIISISISILCFLLLKAGFAQEIKDPALLWQSPESKNFNQIQQNVEAYYADKDKGRGSGYVQWKRWERDNEIRLDRHGNIQNYNKIAFDEHHRYQAQHETSSSRTNTGFWTEIGPVHYNRVGKGSNGGLGRVNVIAFHPGNSSIIYVGTPAGGLWKTITGGNSWFPLTDGLPRIGISGIAIDYNNPDIIYILTGDGDGNNSYSIGVLKSTNGGNSWQSTDLTFVASSLRKGWKLLMHPSNSNILFAGTNDGLFRTQNGGLSWTNVQVGSINDIEFNPGNSAIMYATRMLGSSVFYRSTDGGQTWSTAGISGEPINCSRIEIAVTPANNSYVYLLAGPSTGAGSFKGVHLSTDNGLNFSAKSTTPNILSRDITGSDNTHQTTYDLAIAASRTAAGTVITGGINVWRSTNSGSTMVNASQWNETTATEYVHADIHELVYNSLNNYLYCGSDGGISVSTDHGVNWSDISQGLTIMQFYNIDIDVSNQYLFIGGTQDNGTNYRNSNTSTFTHMEGNDGGDCMIDYNNSNILYGVGNQWVWKSTNGGAWTSGITPPNTWWYPRLAMHPITSSTIFVGTSTVYRSIDGGTNWTDIGAQGTRAIIQGTNNVNRLYAANSTVLQMSYNALSATVAWDTISGNTGWLNSQQITSLALDPLWSLNIYVGKGGYTANEKVLFSNDAGFTWANLTGSLPNVPILCLEFEPGSNGGIYAGTDIGVFYRNNEIGDWIPYRNGLPVTRAEDLDINSITGILYAGTHGRGLWSSPTYSNCPINWNLTNSNLPGFSSQGVRLYQASSYISSNRSISGTIGTDITYKAGNYIDLKDGFELKAGAEFYGYNDTCGGGIPIAKGPVSGTYEGPMEGVATAVSEDERMRDETYVKAYPNPFDKQTNIEFKLDKPGMVDLFISDLTGKVIMNLIDQENYPLGTFIISTNPMKVSSGVYFANYRNGEQLKIIKLIVSN